MLKFKIHWNIMRTKSKKEKRFISNKWSWSTTARSFEARCSLVKIVIISCKLSVKLFKKKFELPNTLTLVVSYYNNFTKWFSSRKFKIFRYKSFHSRHGKKKISNQIIFSIFPFLYSTLIYLLSRVSKLSFE